MKQRFHSCFNTLEKDIEEPLNIEDIYFYEQEVEVTEEPIDMEYYEEVEVPHQEIIKQQINKYGDKQ